MPHTILYARVSTSDQTIEHQQTQAEKAGFKIDEVVCDQGVSGVTTRFADREGGKRLLDKVRPNDVLLCRWVDRLGRNYCDVTQTIRDLMAKGVVVKTVINGMTFDGATTDPIQMAIRDAMIGFMAATAQAQIEATKSAQLAGIAHAKAHNGAEKFKGRKPSFTQSQLELVLERLNAGDRVTAIANTTGLSRQTIYRIQSDPTAASASIANWR